MGLLCDGSGCHRPKYIAADLKPSGEPDSVNEGSLDVAASHPRGVPATTGLIVDVNKVSRSSSRTKRMYNDPPFSSPKKEIPTAMGFRAEFDPANKILLLRIEGRFTDELAAEVYRAIRKYSIATDASAGIFDCSSVTAFAVSPDFIRQLARQEPSMPDALRRPRIIVAPTALGFGLARMFQIMGEPTRPLLQVVRSLEEALAALGVQSQPFEPLQ